MLEQSEAFKAELARILLEDDVLEAGKACVGAVQRIQIDPSLDADLGQVAARRKRDTWISPSMPSK